MDWVKDYKRGCVGKHRPGARSEKITYFKEKTLWRENDFFNLMQ
jgi:hypothetical protein